jgi:hypothetical protein
MVKKLIARLYCWFLRYAWFGELFFDGMVGWPVREQEFWLRNVLAKSATEEQIQQLLRELEEKRLCGK